MKKKTKKKADLIDRANVIKMLEARIQTNKEWLEDSLTDKEYFVSAHYSSILTILGLVLGDVKRFPTKS